MMQPNKTLFPRGVSRALSLLAAVGMLLWAVPPAHAQNVASQKAYFGSGVTGSFPPAKDVIGFLRSV